MSEGFMLITGRTPEQGKALHQGKCSEVYRRATALVEMSPEDMARLGIEEGQIVQVRTAAGQVEVVVRAGIQVSGPDRRCKVCRPSPASKCRCIQP